MKNFYLTSILLAGLVAGAVSDKVVFKDCGSVGAKVIEVDITPCPKLPCEFARGTSVVANITFLSNEASTAVKSVVHGIIGGIPIPFPLPDSDACKSTTPACPLVTGTQYGYTTKLDVLTSYPTISLIVKWELVDPNTTDLVCFEIPVRIV